MSPEHAELEADWLAEELGRAAKYAREAYNDTVDSNKRQLALANLIGTLDTLYAHYRLLGSESEPQTQDDQRQFEYRGKKRRGWVARLFLGDN